MSDEPTRDAASEVGPPAQGTQGEGARAESQGSAPPQALVASVDGTAARRGRMGAREFTSFTITEVGPLYDGLVW